MEKRVLLDELHKAAAEILEKAKKIKSKTATVIALSGDLGAGKTTLAQELAKQLGVKEPVLSPTFVILKSYKTKDSIFENLIHIDAYRLKKSSELFQLGWQEIFKNKHNLIIIEWPEQVPECIPKNACKIKLSHVDHNKRNIKF